ncbi:MAG TPA: hypothetical protein DEQ61_01150, partial [Streptomyces sp.]|nr:hypothetical protein [Streptomyces sp.]
QITGFRLSLIKGMGNSRGNAETGFIRSVDQAVDRFYSSVVAQLERRPRTRPPRAADPAPPAAADAVGTVATASAAR